MTPAKLKGRRGKIADHERRDDALLLDGRPRSANRRKPLDQSKAAKAERAKAKADPLQAVRRKQATEAKNALPKKGVDPFAGVRKADRPMTDEQRSTLSAMSRDPLLSFDYRQAATLTRGQADRLIPRLRQVVKQRKHAQLTKTNKRTKSR